MSTESQGNGAAIGGWICFVLGMAVMAWSLWFFLVYGPLFLVSFVLAIVCLARRQLGNGIGMLLATLVVPVVTFVTLGTLRTDAALKELNAIPAKTRATAPAKPAALSPAPALPAPSPNDDPLLYLAAEKIELYDFKAAYFNAVLGGRMPGVEFKLRNKGERTLKRVKVVVYFQDKAGSTISEQEFYPVNVSQFTDSAPLKPGYVWQPERGKFLSAKKVPSEWVEGAGYCLSLKLTAGRFRNRLAPPPPQ